MRLTIVNASTRIKTAEFRAAVRAIGRQVKEHFTPEWGIHATLAERRAQVAPKSKVTIDDAADAFIYVGDAALDPTTGVDGALGYHSTNHSDKPYGFVYLDVCDEYKEEWTCTLSHEVLELLADPDASLTVGGPNPGKGATRVYFDLEVCDPVQGDTYRIDDVVVSNFVTRRYFDMRGKSSATNHLGLPLKRFGVRPGGYFQYESGGRTHQVNGSKAARLIAQRAAARARMGGARRNNRRSVRLAG